MTQPLQGPRRAKKLAIEIRPLEAPHIGHTVTLVRFIDPDDRNTWVAERPHTRFAVNSVERMGTDAILYDIEGATI